MVQIHSARPLSISSQSGSAESLARYHLKQLRLKWMRCSVSEDGNCYEPDPFVFPVDTPIIGIGFSGNFSLAVYENIRLSRENNFALDRRV
jgi:hypothetical protein